MMKRILALVTAAALGLLALPGPALAAVENAGNGRYLLNGISVSFNGKDVSVLALGENGVLEGGDVAEPDSFLRMVSKAFPISKEQADSTAALVKISRKPYQNAKYGAQYIDPLALKALEALVAKAKAGGFKKTQLVEAYRSYDLQQKRFDEGVKRRIREGMSEQEATEATHFITALPGESEHHLGVTLDVLQKGDSMALSFAKTKFAKWLAANASEFGFTLRYPEDKSDITGITYEPWHLRYVGLPLAKALESRGMCMEEFYAALREEKVMEELLGGETYAFVYVEPGGSVTVSPSLAEGMYYSETGEGGGVLIAKAA